MKLQTYINTCLSIGIGLLTIHTWLLHKRLNVHEEAIYVVMSVDSSSDVRQSSFDSAVVKKLTELYYQANQTNDILIKAGIAKKK